MVEYITINGEKHPVIINYYVIGELQRETGCKMSDFTDIENKLYLIEPFLYYAIKYGHKVEGSEFSIKREDFYKYVVDNKVYIDFLNLFGKFFIQDSEENKKK